MTDAIDILVVDDQPENLRLMRKLLTARGFRVLEADSAERALDAVAAKMPDILLVDIRLGDGAMTGYELAGRIRRLPGGDQAVLVALSGGAELDDDARAPEKGFDGFIMKPFAFAELVDRLLAFRAKKAEARG